MDSASVRHDIRRAPQAGLDAAHITSVTGVPPRTQRRIPHEENPYGMNDSQLHFALRLDADLYGGSALGLGCVRGQTGG